MKAASEWYWSRPFEVRLFVYLLINVVAFAVAVPVAVAVTTALEHLA